MKKVVKAVYVHNFCEQIEFEGSELGNPDVMQVGRGQVWQMRVKVGSVFDTETGEWEGLREDQEGVTGSGQSQFGEQWNPVPPVDPQVLKAAADAQQRLEDERKENAAKFILPKE